MSDHEPDVPQDEAAVDDERASHRSELLPEEETAGSEAPEDQARAILAESNERSASRQAAPDTHLEHRTSDEVTPPAE